MSVLFATISLDSIILCADKQTTHVKNTEIRSETATKIEKWSPTIAIGRTGIQALGEIISSHVREYVEEDGLDNFTLEDIADLFCQFYYGAREVYTDMPKEAHAQLIVAGKLSNGKAGIIQVMVGNDEASTEVIEADTMPATLILAPDDMTDEECNQLLKKAILNTKNKNIHQRDFLETVHRKAVRYVSERSKWVGPKSDYLVIRPNDPQ